MGEVGKEEGLKDIYSGTAFYTGHGAEIAHETKADVNVLLEKKKEIARKKASGEMVTMVKGLGLCGNSVGANAAEIDVKDGKIVRTRPISYYDHYTKEQLNEWTYNVRGTSFSASSKTCLPPFAVAYKKRATSGNRIPYPMKRVDWEPGGNPGKINSQNRGKSKYARISWDEAIGILVSEIKRIQETYGPYSLLCQSDGHGETKTIHTAHGCNTNLLDRLGGYTCQARNPDSWEGWHWGAKHVWGQSPLGQADQNNNIWDVSHYAQQLFFWGCDVNTTPWAWGGQNASRLCYWFRELGIKQVYICPDFNYGAAQVCDKWVPVYPNTDAALQVSIIYVWLTEDLYDKEYVDVHCTGTGPFFDYVLGKEDGVPKTPKWGEKLTGVPARTIKAIARNWAKKRTSMAHGNGGSFIRSAYSHEPARLEAICLAMQGVGKPGRQSLKMLEWQMMSLNTAMPAPRSEAIPYPGGAFRGRVKGVKPSFIPKTMIPEALLGNWTPENPLRWYSFPDASYPAEWQFVQFQYPVQGAEPVHMIWSDSPCWSTCWNGGNSVFDAYRDPRIETIITQHPWFENDCMFADVLLPVVTKFEVDDFGTDTCGGDYNLMFYEAQCIDPVGEAMSDYQIVCEVAKCFGDDVYENYTGGKTVEEYITAGYESSRVVDKITFEDWLDQGYMGVPTAKDWEKDPCGLAPFASDPENHPLATDNGKIMFYSDNIAAIFPDDKERGPFPKYVAEGVSHHESFSCERAEEYPFLMVSNHPHWRCHAQLDDITWLREIPTCKIVGPDGYRYEPAWINPVDAEKLGVKAGDVVKIYNERGWVLGGVYVTGRIAEHVVLQDHGARVDPIEPGVSDRGGANNLICPTSTTSKNAPGEVTSGFLVGIEKVDVFELAKQYPEAFSRTFDDEGVCISNWLVSE